MKVCIFGAGAIGGYLAVELALAGNEVSVVARGAHLRAIHEHGLTLRIDGNEKTVRLPASGAWQRRVRWSATRCRCCRISSAASRWKSMRW